MFTVCLHLPSQHYLQRNLKKIKRFLIHVYLTNMVHAHIYTHIQIIVLYFAHFSHVSHSCRVHGTQEGGQQAPRVCALYWSLLYLLHTLF